MAITKFTAARKNANEGNTFYILPLKDAAGNFTGGMDFDPELLNFEETIVGKNNMKFTNMNYAGKRIMVETPEMKIPAGVVQYPKPEDVNPGDRVSYTLLMSFDNMESRPDIRAYKDFLEIVQAKVLDMAFMRSSELFGKSKSKDTLADLQSDMIKASSNIKYAPSTAIGLPFTVTTVDGEEIMKPSYRTYDINTMRKGKDQASSLVPSIHTMSTKRGTVKVVYPMSAVWSNQKGFGISMKATSVVVREGATDDGHEFDLDLADDEELLEDEEDDEVGDLERETEGLGLDN